VPSCDAHNSKKSKDDEFLRTVLTMASGKSSSVASHQFFGKVLRAAQRRPVAYSAFLKKTRAKTDKGGRGFRLDRPRFDSSIAHLARAIYFHTYATKWILPVFVVSPNFYSAVGRRAFAHEPSLATVEATRKFLENEPLRGENREVFVYRAGRAEGAFAFAALFYESFEVYAYSSPHLANAA
jgi:hypothetical protein